MISLYESKGRKEWVDLGKGISILLVVLFHCEEYLPIVDTGTKEIFSFFRMPFFFFLSGYVFTSDYREFSFGKNKISIAIIEATKNKRIVNEKIHSYLLELSRRFIKSNLMNISYHI